MRMSGQKKRGEKNNAEMFHVKHSVEYSRVQQFLAMFFSDEKREKFFEYFDMLVDYNTRINLYSRNSDGFALEHFTDSICASLKMSEVGNIIDVGSGNGMPGIVYSIIYPKSQVVLCERSEKKSFFLKTAIQNLNLKNVSILNKSFDNDLLEDNFTVVMKGVNPFQMQANIKGYTDFGRVLYFSSKPLKTGNVRATYYVPVYSRTNYIVSINNNIIKDRCLWEK